MLIRYKVRSYNLNHICFATSCVLIRCLGSNTNILLNRSTKSSFSSSEISRCSHSAGLSSDIYHTPGSSLSLRDLAPSATDGWTVLIPPASSSESSKRSRSEIARPCVSTSSLKRDFRDSQVFVYQGSGIFPRRLTIVSKYSSSSSSKQLNRVLPVRIANSVHPSAQISQLMLTDLSKSSSGER